MRSICLLGALGLMALPAAAQTPQVNAARASGIVGERFDGYLGYAAAVPSTVRSQVESINIRRRTLYSNLAARKGVSPREVGVTAGCQLLGRVGVGQSYMLNDGVWRRRATAQPIPIPAYCG